MSDAAEVTIERCTEAAFLMKNSIDKDKITDTPSTLPYPHTIGSAIIKPEDIGKVKSRAHAAMLEQTHVQLNQIQKQVELLLDQARRIQERVTISEDIYRAHLTFEPFVGNIYHLYKQAEQPKLMMIAPDEWGKSKPADLHFMASVRLLSDHTWEVIENQSY